jgi:hypothetical protein
MYAVPTPYETLFCFDSKSNTGLDARKMEDREEETIRLADLNKAADFNHEVSPRFSLSINPM